MTRNKLRLIRGPDSKRDEERFMQVGFLSAENSKAEFFEFSLEGAAADSEELSCA